MTELTNVSTAYQAAYDAHNEATRAYRAILTAYRAMEIGDEEFLLAQVRMYAAHTKFDVAFELEAKGRRSR